VSVLLWHLAFYALGLLVGGWIGFSVSRTKLSALASAVTVALVDFELADQWEKNLGLPLTANDHRLDARRTLTGAVREAGG
jgi:uncharacterized membrane protein YedE/YeeE